jgi:hypothetical protein
MPGRAPTYYSGKYLLSHPGTTTCSPPVSTLSTYPSGTKYLQPPFAVSPCARLGVVCSLVISNNHRQSGGRVRILPATTASTSAPPQRRKSDQNKLGRVGNSRSGAMGAECEFTLASDLGRTRWPSVFTEKIQRRISSRGSWPCSRVLMERRQIWDHRAIFGLELAWEDAVGRFWVQINTRT